MAKVQGTPARPDKPMKPAKTKPGRANHPLVNSKDTNVFPFKVLPTDFDFDTMKGLKKKSFATEAAYYDYRAKEMDHKAAKFRVQAEEAKKTGSGAERNKAKKLVKLQSKMAELKAQLAAQGVDVDALLKKAGQVDAEAAETETVETAK